MYYHFDDQKIENANDFIEILLLTNPPIEITRKLEFLKKLNWGFKPEDFDQDDGTTMIIAENEAFDDKGLPALTYNISWKKEEGKSEELIGVHVQFYDNYGSWYRWGKDFIEYGLAD